MCNIYTTPSQKEHLVAKAAYDKLCSDWDLEHELCKLPFKQRAKIRGIAIWMICKIIYARLGYGEFLQTCKTLESKLKGFGKDLFYILGRKGNLVFEGFVEPFPSGIWNALDAAAYNWLYQWIDRRRFALFDCEFDY